jgi:hypothetical protein
MPQLRAYVTLGISALLTVICGCTSRRSTQLKPETFVGEYVYYSADRGAPHDPDRLTLRADGRYMLVHMPGGRPGRTEEGRWQLYNNPPGGGDPQLAFGGRWYPIEVSGKRVRLLIDLDLGHWYDKIQ